MFGDFLLLRSRSDYFMPHMYNFKRYLSEEIFLFNFLFSFQQGAPTLPRVRNILAPPPSQNTSAYPSSLEQIWQEVGSLGRSVPQHGCWSKGIFSQKPRVKSLIFVLGFCIPPPHNRRFFHYT